MSVKSVSLIHLHQPYKRQSRVDAYLSAGNRPKKATKVIKEMKSTTSAIVVRDAIVLDVGLRDPSSKRFDKLQYCPESLSQLVLTERRCEE